MNRDENTREEAIERIEEVKELMSECNYDPFECDGIMRDFLELEPDYMFDLLDI